MKINKLITALAGISTLGASTFLISSCSHEPVKSIKIEAITNNPDINNNHGRLSKATSGTAARCGFEEISFNTYSATQLALQPQGLNKKTNISWWYAYEDGQNQSTWTWSLDLSADLERDCGFSVKINGNNLFFDASKNPQACHFKSFALKFQYQEGDKIHEANPVLVHFHNAPIYGTEGSNKILEVNSSGEINKFAPDFSTNKYDVIYIPSTYDDDAKPITGITWGTFNNCFNGTANTFCEHCDNIIFADRSSQNPFILSSNNFTASNLVLGDIYIGEGTYTCTSTNSIALFTANGDSNTASFHTTGHIVVKGSCNISSTVSYSAVDFFAAESNEKSALLDIDGGVDIQGKCIVSAPAAQDVLLFSAFSRNADSDVNVQIDSDINIQNDILAFATTAPNSNVFTFSAFSYQNADLYVQGTVNIKNSNFAVVGHNQSFFYSDNTHPTKIKYQNSVFKSRGGFAPEMNVQWDPVGSSPTWSDYTAG